MQTFENLLLQKYLTEFFDIAHKYSLGMCKFVQMVLPNNNVKLYNITIIVHYE